MTDRPPRTDDELLSAYFDGEVTPEERARVEVLRNTSPAAAAELDSYAELSQLLKGLPRESAPPEVRAAAVQLAERSSLLAMPVMPRKAAGRFLREAVIGFVSLAAGVLVTVAVQSSRPAHQRWDNNGVAFTAAAPVAAPTADRLAHSLESSVHHVSDGFVAPRAEMDDGVSVGIRTDGDTDGVAEFGVVMTQQPIAGSAMKGVRSENNGSVANGSMTTTSGGESFKQGEAELKAVVPVEDVVANLAATNPVNDNFVSNLDVFYRNPEAGAEAFQKIMAGNGIHVADAVEDKSGESTRAVSRRAETRVELTEQQLPAVYFEAPIDPVTRSLVQLAQQPEMVGVRLRPPLELPLEDDNAVALYRARHIDLQRLKDEYSRSQELLSAAILADLERPVSAIEAVERERKEPLSKQELAQREMNFRYNSVRSQISRNSALNVPQTGPSATAAPVAPLPVQQQPELFTSQFRFNVPVTTTNLRSDPSGNTPQGVPTPATPDRPAADEAQRQLGKYYANYYGNTGNVRMLVVFQEAAASATAPVPADAITTPAAPPASRIAPATKKKK
jgi:hypothetical protein